MELPSSLPSNSPSMDASQQEAHAEARPIVFRGKARNSSPSAFMSDFADATHDLLMEDAPSLRAAAARKLASLGNPLASPYLIAALSDSSPDVRLAVAQSLAQIGDAWAIAPLKDLLNKRQPGDTLGRAVSDAMRSIVARESNLSSAVSSSSHQTTDSTHSSAVDAFHSAHQQKLKLEEARAKAKAEARAQTAREAQQIVELEVTLKNTQAESRERAEHERALKTEIETLRLASAEITQCIKEAEAALNAVIAALHRAQAVQVKRMEAAEAEARRLAEEEARLKAEEKARLQANADERELAAREILQMVEAEDKLRTAEQQKHLTALEEIKDTALAGQLKSDDPAVRGSALRALKKLGEEQAFDSITCLFDDESAEVRKAAARALYEFNSDRPGSFTRALREGSSERRHHIAMAIESSGLALQAIDGLEDESREKTYDAFSILFLMAKGGHSQLLIKTIEHHPSMAVRLSIIKLLTLSNQADIVPAFRRLAVRSSLPTEVRSAVMESIYQIRANAQNSRSAA